MQHQFLSMNGFPKEECIAGTWCTLQRADIAHVELHTIISFETVFAEDTKALDHLWVLQSLLAQASSDDDGTSQLVFHTFSIQSFYHLLALELNINNYSESQLYIILNPDPYKSY